MTGRLARGAAAGDGTKVRDIEMPLAELSAPVAPASPTVTARMTTPTISVSMIWAMVRLPRPATS